MIGELPFFVILTHYMISKNLSQTFIEDIMNYSFSVELPKWAIEHQNALPEFMPNPEDRMRAVIEFSRQNIRQQTGGPFAAGIFEKKTGKRVMLGVNRVMPTNCSTAHAEVVAIALAQQKLASFDLGGTGMADHELVVNWRPCIMCLGALMWSGVRHLTIAGSGPELETITGFDEGFVPADWVEQLKMRGISVEDNLLNSEAIEVFREFADSGSYVYNARQND